MKMIGWLAVMFLAHWLSMKRRQNQSGTQGCSGQRRGFHRHLGSGSGCRAQVNVHDLTPGEHGIHFHQGPSAKGRISNPQADISIPKARSTVSIAQTATTPVT